MPLVRLCCAPPTALAALYTVLICAWLSIISKVHSSLSLPLALPSQSLYTLADYISKIPGGYVGTVVHIFQSQPDPDATVTHQDLVVPELVPAPFPTRRMIHGSDVSEPPLYSIDLDLPPESRYAKICNDYKDEMAELAKIYDEILSTTPYPRFFGFLARNLLNKVYLKEETEEIRAISKATRIPIFRVVAYNTFLDLFSSCMSGGVQTKVGASSAATSVLHFRNLDWEMEPLRNMIIRVEYLVKGKIVAR